MSLTPLTALSPLDGRYAQKCAALRPIFSELGLIRRRVKVELAWLAALADTPGIPEVAALGAEGRQRLTTLGDGISSREGERVKALEAETNHDVKAVEYFLKEALGGDPGLAPALEFVHFACTSEDINNLAYALMLRDARDEVLLPALDAMIGTLRAMAHNHAGLAMLSRTHGQTASPRSSRTSWPGSSASARRSRGPRCRGR